MNGNRYNTNNTQQKYMTSVPKIMFGLMKEIQRSNRLRAMELKLMIDPGCGLKIEDVDDVMNTDPAGSYGRTQQDTQDYQPQTDDPEDIFSRSYKAN